MFVISKEIVIQSRIVTLFWSAKMNWWTQLSFEAKVYSTQQKAIAKLNAINDADAKVISNQQPVEQQPKDYGLFCYEECLNIR